jgi:hypothetical protein
MRTRNYLSPAALAVAFVAFFISAEVKAQLPTSCVAGGFTMTTDTTFPFQLSSGDLRWRYRITGANTNKISLGVLVVPRPVSPTDIVPTSPLNYCQQSDTNTKINRGNCNGFPINVTAQLIGTTAFLDVITKNNVTQDLVTWNIVSGTGTSDTCLSNATTGIAGPGDIFNPASIVSTTQTFSSPANQCPVDVIRNAKGDIVSVKISSSAASWCGPGGPGTQITSVPVSNLSVNGVPLEFAGSGSPGGGIFALGSTHSCMRMFDPSTGKVYLISTNSTGTGCVS